MKICHVCNMECNDDAEICLVCGADLTEKPSPESQTESEPEFKQPVLLASMDDIVSAEIFKDILKDNEIPYMSGNDANENTMRVVFGGGFVSEDIYVEKENFEKANMLYAEFLENKEEFDGEFIFDDNQTDDSEEV